MLVPAPAEQSEQECAERDPLEPTADELTRVLDQLRLQPYESSMRETLGLVRGRPINSTNAHCKHPRCTFTCLLLNDCRLAKTPSG